MGLFKAIFSLSTGIPMRLTTGRERSRRYQREANDLLEEQLDAMQNLAQPQTPSDTRPRGTCPACLEMMLRGASTCPHCHTTGIIWPRERKQIVDTSRVCSRCAGQVFLNNRHQVCCSGCKAQYSAREYPHLSAGSSH